MFDITQAIIAYGLAALIILAVAPWSVVMLARRRSLRLRGIAHCGP